MSCFFFHEWGRWSEPKSFPTGFGGSGIRQIRTCATCGKVKARTIDWLIEPDLSGDEIGQ